MLNTADTEKQAAYAVADWMEMAIHEVNGLFGDGYAEKPPELVAAFMGAAVSHEMAMSLRGVTEVLESLRVMLFKASE